MSAAAGAGLLRGFLALAALAAAVEVEPRFVRDMDISPHGRVKECMLGLGGESVGKSIFSHSSRTPAKRIPRGADIEFG